MKIEKNVDINSVNKLFRHTRVQRTVIEFWGSNDLVWKITFNSDEYKNLRSAQSTYCGTIKRLGLNICARCFNGSLYLIKLEVDE